MTDFRIYSEKDGRTFAVLSAASEASALLGISWGYAGATFRRDANERPLMDCAGEIYRAEIYSSPVSGWDGGNACPAYRMSR